MEQTTKKKKQFSPLERVGVVIGGLVLLALAVFAVSSLISHGRHYYHPAATATVYITKTGFVPATLSVAKGTEIIWTNSDSVLHQVASNPYPQANGLPGLKSEILNKGQSFSYTAETTGSFGYHDQLKPTINGMLVVRKP